MMVDQPNARNGGDYMVGKKKAQRTIKRIGYEHHFTKMKTTQPITRNGITSSTTTFHTKPRQQRTTKEKKTAKKQYKKLRESPF